MKPLLIALAVVLGLGAVGFYVYFSRISRYEPSVRSMVANEQRQGRFLLLSVGMLLAAGLVWWLA